MATRPSRDKTLTPDELNAEHQALKDQTAALRREHERLHAEGGTRAEHQQHIAKLRVKLKELEEHVEHLRGAKRGV